MSSSIIDLGMVPYEEQHLKRREANAANQNASKAKNCAECRRLKVKCDRKVPCQNCVKRGCASICPDGSLVSKGNRLVLSNTEDLHGKIEELSSRIRELESALASSYGKHSDETHPLLTPDQLLTGSIRRDEEDPNEAPVTSFGSLMLGDDGTSKFFGATSGAEWVIPLEDDSPQQGYACAPISVAGTRNPFKKTPNLDLINASFPSASDPEVLDIPALRKLIIDELPPKETAISLINLYYARVAWEFDPVPRARLISDFFAPCYDNMPKPAIGPHGLALLYAVFGMGMFHNPEQTNYGALAYQYITLSRASLASDCMFVNTTVTSIDAMILHITYFQMSDDPGGGAKAWAALGTTLKLAQAIGLHREPSLWGLPLEEVMHRRRTMWELVSLDLWSACHVGRPPMISRQHFDVQIPLENPDASEAEPNFHRGKHYFSESCLWPVLDVALAAANRATYGAVLKLDKKIRDWVLPLKMQVPVHVSPEEQQTALIFQRTVMFTVREVTLQCLHRSYFGCALMEPPFDPLRHRYSRSVLAVYASACAILGRIRTLYAREPIIITRFWFFWTHSFSAAVMLGAIVARAPDCALAPTALIEFDHTVEMFRRAQHGYNAGRLFPTLLELQTKAQTAFEAFKNGTWSRPTTGEPALFPGLGGSRALVQHTRQQPSQQPSPSDREAQQQSQSEQQNQQSAASPQSQSSDDGSNVMVSLGNVQPALDEYLRSFGIFNGAETGNANGIDANANRTTNAEVNGGANATVGGNVDANGNESTGGQMPMQVPSSDAFLRGALTGDWAALGAPVADGGFGGVIDSPPQLPLQQLQGKSQGQGQTQAQYQGQSHLQVQAQSQPHLQNSLWGTPTSTPTSASTASASTSDYNLSTNNVNGNVPFEPFGQFFGQSSQFSQPSYSGGGVGSANPSVPFYDYSQYPSQTQKLQPGPPSISSVMDFGAPNSANYAGQQPRARQQQYQQQSTQQMQPATNIEAGFIWDNFLQGLGLQGYDKSI